MSDEIYWKMNASSPPGEPAYPSLTLGALLLSLKRIEIWPLSSRQEARKLRIQSAIEHIRMKWRTAWAKKSREEFRSRLDLWRNYLEELRKEPELNIDRYSYEVNRRVMLNLLSKEADAIPPAQEQMLAGLDLVLDGLMAVGEFIWDEELAAGFVRSEYPYLYFHLKKPCQTNG
jgi:hypothetical protein